MALDPAGGWSLTPVGTGTASTSPLAPQQPQYSPDQIKQMRAEAMALQQPPAQPIRHWTQGLAELVRAIQGNREADFARQSEAEGRRQGADAISQIYAPYLSPGGANQPSGAGAASAGSTGGASADASPPVDIKPPAAQTGDTPTPSSAAATPRGIRNNNPLNIEDGPFAKSQPGYTGSDGRFATFQTPEHGTSAADKLLNTYSTKYGLNTVAGIVNRWAPQADGNNTNAYAAAVAAKLGIGPNDPIPPGMRNQLIAAMAEHENGVPFKMPGMAATAPTPGQPTGLLAPFQSATAAPPPSASAPPPASAAPAPAAAPTPPVRVAYAGAGLPAGAIPSTPSSAAASGAAPAAPPPSPIAPIVNAINGKPLPPPVSPEAFAAAANGMVDRQSAAAAAPGNLPKPSTEPVPPADFIQAVKAAQEANPLGGASPSDPNNPLPPVANMPPTMQEGVPLPRPRPAGAPAAVSPTVAPLVSAIAGGQPPSSGAPVSAPIPPPPTQVAQNGPLTTVPPAAATPPSAPGPSPSGLPQPLTSAAGQVTQDQLTRVLANPWVPDNAKAAMLQMIQQRGQPQLMPVEGGTLMYNSAGQRVFIPEPKFGTIKVGGAEIPTVSHFDPATRRWNTTTLAPGGGVQTVGGAATGQAPTPGPAAAGEPDLSTIGGIQRAEVAQAGAKKAAEAGGEASAKYYDSLHKGLAGSAMIAAQQKQNIDLLRQVADSPNFTPGYGSDAALGLQRMAAQLGINPEGAAPRELFNQVATRVLADQISGIKSMASETGETGGRIFKSMLDLEEKANITPEDSAAGVKAKLNLIDNAGNLMMKWADLADDYVKDHGKLDAGFDKTLRSEISKARIPNAVPQAQPAAPAAAPAVAPPQVGTVDSGYRFKGGNPADKNNWEPVGAPVSQ